MNKNLVLKLAVMLIVPLLIVSCLPDDEDPPSSDFYASKSFSSSEIVYYFTDLSTGSPDEWYWTFEGGTPSTSTEQNPVVTFTEPGMHTVTLVTKNGGGEDELVMYDYINVVQFNNVLYTDIDITVDGDYKTISPDSYVLFSKINNSSFSYYAETSGQTTGGAQIGLLVYWDYEPDIVNGSSIDLWLSSDYLFAYLTNTGNYTLSSFYVNYGTADQTYDNIEFPNNGVKYRTGYYRANYGMEIRAYYSSSYVYWVNPSNLTIPWTDNQSVSLLSTTKSSVSKDINGFVPENEHPETLFSVTEVENKTKSGPNTIKMYQSN